MIPEGRNQFRPLAYLASQYLWLIVFRIIAILTSTFPYQIKSVTVFPSQNTNTWSSSSNPHILSHMSDIHFSKYQPSNNIQGDQMFNLAAKYKVKELVITGDLTSSYRTNISSAYAVAEQQVEEWKEYHKMMSRQPQSFVESHIFYFKMEQIALNLIVVLQALDVKLFGMNMNIFAI